MRDPLWLTRAKALPAGRSTRVVCCATDTSMLVTNDKNGYRGYCFRCGEHPFVPHGLFSIEQLARRKAEQALLVERDIRLPADFTTNIPSDCAVWLYRAGIGNDMAQHYGFGYSASIGRVILPVYKEGVLDGFTARSTTGARPKYIERFRKPSEAIFIADTRTQLASASAWREATGPDLVITEDVFSAVRVGRVVRNAVSLLGTSASSHQLFQITEHLATTSRIAVWLDGDAAGQRGAETVVRALAVQGYNVRNIVTKHDPKKYSNREIERILTYD